MQPKSAISIVLLAIFLIIQIPSETLAFVTKKDGRTYIVDRQNEQWDVTEAMTLGFKARNFQYGIGRHAFQTLDDSSLTDNQFFMSSTDRIIAFDDSAKGKAFSVDTLRNHEIANSWQGEKPVMVGY